MEQSNVTITIKTLQRRAEATESMTQRAEGSLRREGEGWTLTYGESDEQMGEIRTTLQLEPGRAVLTREGALRTQMVFRKGEPYACRYATPYGELPMTLRTLRLDWELGAAGGSVFLIYKIELDGANVGENRLRLTVKAKGERI